MRKKKAFTLIEILITMIIMGTLSSTIIPRIWDARERTNETVKMIEANRNIACGIDGLDDMCDNTNGVHYEWDDISICRNEKCITMKDKNIWATSNDIKSTDSYWYYYQWWNNYGFSLWCFENWCLDKNLNVSSKEIEWNDNYNDNWFSSWIFITASVDYWLRDMHYDWLRWWELDSNKNNWWYNIENMTAINAVWRQWPCPNWYHVPNLWEWEMVLNNRSQAYDISLSNLLDDWDISKFQKDFKIPLAGRIHNLSAKPQEINRFAAFWSSTPNASNGYAYYLSLDILGSIDTHNDSRALWLPIRCFKN